MTITETSRSTDATTPVSEPTTDRQPVDWRRVRRPLSVVCLSLAFVGAVASSLGSVVAGRLADSPTSMLVGVLALCVVGGAFVDTAARTIWGVVVDRAEGRLRADLIDAAMAQPLSELSEQAVGEVLDRIDDDTWEVGQLMRWGVWMAIRTVLSAGPLWIVAAITWWPAAFLFPLCGVAVWFAIRRLLPLIAERKVLEEAAWTDHAASTEEGIAARDDVRTSLGQPHVLRRNAELAAEIHRRLRGVLAVEVSVTRRSGGLLHGVLAATGLLGVALVLHGDLSTARLVTLFLVTTMFVGQVDMLARHLPDLQEGMGAVLRLRGMMSVPAEPVGGLSLPHGPLDVELRGLAFSYGTGSFALRDIDLSVPAGHTCALVGRTGSGKSTLASFLSRAVEPPPGTVFLGGTDVLELDLQQLRSAVGVVTQRTEILAGTLVDNITLFGEAPRESVVAAVEELGLTEWVAGLPEGLDTLLGPGGTSLSAGEEQLVAFARLLVRDVSVVVLDEATARMDPVTEARVVRAADRLISGRTGILVAHRLSTTERAEQVAVLEAGRVVQQGPRDRLAVTNGPFRDLLDAAAHEVVIEEHHHDDSSIGSVRRSTTPPEPPHVDPPLGLMRQVWHVIRLKPEWGLLGALLFLVASITGAYGAITGFVWGHVVTTLQDGDNPGLLLLALVASLMIGPLLLSQAFWTYPHWWVEVRMRVRAAVLAGQTDQRRLVRTPPGEVVARAMDADRIARYTDRWVDFVNGLLVAVLTALIAGTWLAGAILLAVMVASALASSLGRPVAGRSAAAASAARAGFGQALVSTLESIRTVKLAAATPHLHRHLREVDGGRVDAAVREHRVQSLLDGVPVVMVQCGVVAAWAGLLSGHWELATALLVANAVSGFDWFGRVAGAVVTEAPGTRAWMHATSALAGGGDLMVLPGGMDLSAGTAAAPAAAVREPLRTLTLRDLSAVHDDGTLGVQDVDLEVRAGELVLLLGQVGSGKSSLLGALAGLVSSTGEIVWNGQVVDDPQTTLRPARVAHVAQVPRVLSGTFNGNVGLDHAGRTVMPAIEAARMGRDVSEAGGPESLVGHRGVRLSGGQVQRLALARALATEADVLLADDVSSALDAATEIELWRALRERGATVIGATSKVAALAQADRVLVLDSGRVVDDGPWTELSARWAHLAG
ncbi:ABC-type multidrug transport system, ATPase and permease component [Nocardioides exalbidus]|uniref:ABC-type multidrug transport system, ATPase and permease component n=1 Tax=Nocardioides exalbidus TaxID=402596 RepID=A0A1H4WTH0_9ACTN|nr:ABC transporter ATP-binding protein [Nocardioides exalbidus]SEC96525.1 ABC-type multidrug transport system, ATPase and permease component [Nocardioides exalbidus]